MRRRFALLLVSGLLAFTLAGCGGDDKDTGTQDGTGDMVTDENNDALLGDDNADRHQDDGTSDSGNDNQTDTNGDGILDDLDNGMDDLGNDLENGMNDLGNDLEQGMDNLENSATSYDQMVRNGKVHDTDGILTDGENAHSPGAA